MPPQQLLPGAALQGDGAGWDEGKLAMTLGRSGGLEAQMRWALA